MPMPAFATEANGENSADTSSTATPPTFDPSDTPTPVSAEDESNNDGTENNDLASSGDQEEITIDDDSSDFIGEGEMSDEPSSETVAKAAKLPAARTQINVVVPTVFNFGGDSGYNIDLGTPEEGYLSSTGMFLNKGTGIAQIASVKCSYPKINGVDVPTSEYALTNVEDKKIFGLIDSDMGGEIRFGVSEGVNEADTSGLKEGASYGMVSNVGNMFECRLYLDDVSFNANVADGLTLHPLANVIFTVQALSDNGTIDKDTPDSSLEDGSLPFYLKTFNTDGSVKAIYSAGEVKLHAKSIAVEGTSSPYYERYKAYIDADIEAGKKEYQKKDDLYFTDYEGATFYKADGVTPETDEGTIRSTLLKQYPGAGRIELQYTKHNSGASVIGVSNDVYVCKANINDMGYKRVRIIGIQSNTVSSSGLKTGLTFETIDTFNHSAKTAWEEFYSPETYIYTYWNTKYGYDLGSLETNAAYSPTITVQDSWVANKFPYVSNIETGKELSADFYVLGCSDLKSDQYYYYQKMLEFNSNVFVDYANNDRYWYGQGGPGNSWNRFDAGGSYTRPRPLASYLHNFSSSCDWDYIHPTDGFMTDYENAGGTIVNPIGFSTVDYHLCFSF